MLRYSNPQERVKLRKQFILQYPEDEAFVWIPGHWGRYQISNQGRIYSVDKWVRNGYGIRRRIKGRFLKIWRYGVERLVTLYEKGKRNARTWKVHHIVHFAFDLPMKNKENPR